MSDPLILSHRLCIWRTHKGYTQKQAAELIGIPFPTYRDYELGLSKPAGLGMRWLDDFLAEQMNPENLNQPTN